MALSTPAASAMSDYEFKLLRDLIKERFGIFFSDDSAYLLERRLQPRLEALAMRTFLDYYDFLMNPSLPEIERERELDEIFERVATRETYFFREGYQLDAFREELLPQFQQRRYKTRTLSIWSAGCSTGEEPYSLAIQILESGLFEGWHINLLGSDLSYAALNIARAGVYGQSSFRQTPERLLKRYFRESQGRYQVIDEVKRMVTWTRINLCSGDWVAAGGAYDAIFCRNVLIYFERPKRLAVVQHFARKMTPGGYLLLGHSESLLDLNTPLELCHLKREQVYRKPAP